MIGSGVLSRCLRIINANILIIAGRKRYRKDVYRQEYAKDPIHRHKGRLKFTQLGCIYGFFCQFIDRFAVEVGPLSCVH